MFKLNSLLFGRKKVSSTNNAASPHSTKSQPPEAWQPTVLDSHQLTAEGIYSRCTELARSGQYRANYYIREIIETLSPAERGALITSCASDVETLDKYHGQSSSREAWVSQINRHCLDMETQASKEHLPPLLTLLLQDKRWHRHYYQKQFAALLRLINQAIRDGGFLTSVDMERLGAFGAELRALAEKESSKAHKKTMVRRAETIEKLGGVEVSATSLLLERCEGAENPWALGDRPENYELWTQLLAETVAGLQTITDHLRETRRPAWITDPATFAQSWPAVGPIVPQFSAWSEALEEKYRDFSILRGFTKRRTKGQPVFADPERVRALPQSRAIFAPSLDWRWDTPQIPALDVMADLESPEWTALVEHLISGKVAPRPTAAWRKQALKLAEVLGKATVCGRLADWLALFHSPPLNPETLADRINVEEMDRTVTYLNEKWAELPSQLAAEDIPAAGRAIAMVIASRHDHGFPKPFSPQLIECADRIWDGKSATQGVLRLEAVTPTIANGNRRYDGPQSWLKVSIENEALLRGAMWLAVDILPPTNAIALLEAMALAAAGRHHTGDQGHRSRVVANAAIATLIDLGGADVDAALLRLSGAIPDRTINMALFKALNKAN